MAVDSRGEEQMARWLSRDRTYIRVPQRILVTVPDDGPDAVAQHSARDRQKSLTWDDGVEPAAAHQ